VRLSDASALVTGGASGLGLASAQALAALGVNVTIADLAASAGEEVAKSIGNGTRFAACDVTRTEDVLAAIEVAKATHPLRVLVHCAGRGGPVRVVDRDGSPGSLETYTAIIQINLIGTYNVLRLAAAEMAKNEVADQDRGVCVLTSSIAAYEGQVGQVAYASSKAGVVGMTLVAARDLAPKQIRVCTIAPGIFDTPLLGRVPEDVRAKLAESVPHPRRLGHPEEFARLVLAIIDNPLLNGETIRLDGALRMGPR